MEHPTVQPTPTPAPTPGPAMANPPIIDDVVLVCVKCGKEVFVKDGLASHLLEEHKAEEFFAPKFKYSW